MPKYIKQEMSEKLARDGKSRTFYRMESEGNVDSHGLVDYMAHPGTGISKSEALGALVSLTEAIGHFLSRGHSVTIDGLGTFRSSLGVVEGKEMDTIDGTETKRNAASIEVKDVLFSADKGFVSEVNSNTELKRGSVSRLRKSPYSAEERLAKAVEFLQTNSLMRVVDYASLTGLSRTMASLELRRFAKDETSPITFVGRGSQKVYVLESK